MGSLAKVREEIKQTGKGVMNKSQRFHVSDDIDSAQLKKKAKDFGVTVNDLFTGACISAYSKLDRPEELKPSQLNTIMAYGT